MMIGEKFCFFILVGCLLPLLTVQDAVEIGHGVLSEEELKETFKVCGRQSKGFTFHDKTACESGQRICPYAAQGQFPWAVRIQGGGTLCGGALISKRHVLTASHCFFANPDACTKGLTVTQQEMSNGVGSVWVGAVKLGDSAGNSYNIRKQFVHPRFTDGNCGHGNDIAIIELEKNVVEESAVPICLPEHDAPFKDKGWGYGWGTDPASKSTTEILKFTPLRQLPIKECREHYGGTTPHDAICTDEHVTSVCTGDSGGSLIQEVLDRKQSIGVVSKGGSCIQAYENPDELKKGKHEDLVPGAIFTDVRKHLQFICRHTGVCMPEMEDDEGDTYYRSRFLRTLSKAVSDIPTKSD